jgi:hypothetical protein
MRHLSESASAGPGHADVFARAKNCWCVLRRRSSLRNARLDRRLEWARWYGSGPGSGARNTHRTVVSEPLRSEVARASAAPEPVARLRTGNERRSGAAAVARPARSELPIVALLTELEFKATMGDPMGPVPEHTPLPLDLWDYYDGIDKSDLGGFDFDAGTVAHAWRDPSARFDPRPPILR